jgi:hypothetical protein
MTKLQKYLDKWFEGCGFEALTKTTGVIFYGSDIDEKINTAFSYWASLGTEHRIQWYKTIAFDNHQYTSESEFIRSISRAKLKNHFITAF